MKRLLGTILGLLFLISALPATAAPTNACYDWSCDPFTRTCSFDATCSFGDPIIWFYFWQFGDGGTHFTGSPATSHTYGGESCAFDVTLTVTPFSSEPADTVTCAAVLSVCPIGPQLEFSGHCDR